jgi:hypothetical protein
LPTWRRTNLADELSIQEAGGRSAGGASVICGEMCLGGLDA